MLTDNNTETTPERQEIDPVFKEAVSENFEGLGLPVQTEVEVSQLPRVLNGVKDHTRSSFFSRLTHLRECVRKRPR